MSRDRCERCPELDHPLRHDSPRLLEAYLGEQDVERWCAGHRDLEVVRNDRHALELGEDRSDLFEALLERGRARGDCRLSAELLGERSDRLREPPLLISEELSSGLLCVEELEELLSLPGLTGGITSNNLPRRDASSTAGAGNDVATAMQPDTGTACLARRPAPPTERVRTWLPEPPTTSSCMSASTVGTPPVRLTTRATEPAGDACLDQRGLSTP